MQIFFRLIKRLGSLKLIVLAVVLTIFSAICMEGTVYTLLIWLTLGAALTFVIIPNICVILWAKIGAGVILPNKSSGYLWGVAGLITVLLSLGPSFLAKVNVDKVISQYMQNDVIGDVPRSPAHIKFVYDGVYRNAFSRSCDYICQDLLLTSTVKTLTYESSSLSGNGRKRVNGSNISYKFGKGEACETVRDNKKIAGIARLKQPARAAIRDMMAEGRCIVKLKATEQQADVTITQTIQGKSDLIRANETAPPFVDYKQIGTRTITDKRGKVLVSQGDMVLERPFFPGFFGYSDGKEPETFRLAIMKTKDKSIEDSLEFWGMQRMYPNIPKQKEHVNRRARPKVVPKKQRVDEAIKRANKVLKEAPLNKDFNAAQLKILTLAIHERRTGVITAENAADNDPVIALALKVFADQRVQDKRTLEHILIFLKRRTVDYDGNINAVIFKRLQNAKGQKKAVTLELLNRVPKDLRQAKGALIMRELNQQNQKILGLPIAMLDI